MLKFYVSMRPIQIGNRLYSAKEQFNQGFKGIDVKCSVIAQNRQFDGRYLCEIIVGENSSYTSQQEQDYKAVIIEGLQAWSVHEKSLQSAKDLMELLSGQPCQIQGDTVSAIEE